MAGRAKKRRARDPVVSRIDAVRRSVVSWTMGWGYLWLALLVAAMIFGGVLLDHAFVLQKWGRLAFFRAFVLAVVGGAAAATVLPLVRRMGRLYVARRVELQRPETKNALISYLQCRDDPATPRELKRLLGRRAEQSVANLDAGVVVDYTSYVRLGIGLSVMLLAFLLYAAISPKSATASVQRVLRPNADILPPTGTRLVEIEPRDLLVIAGSQPRLKVRVEGVRPDAVHAVWSGATFADRRVLLTEKDAGWWEGAFPPVLEDGSYHLVAGDTRSDRFRVTALPRPVVTALELRVTPPAYTGRPRRTVRDGALDVVAGAEINVRASTNLPPRAGYVEFDSGRRVWLRPARGGGADLEGRFAALRTDGYAVHFETVQYANGASFMNATPVHYKLTVRDDGAPRVALLAPPDGIRREPSDVVRLTYRAEDDFRVARVRLRYRASSLLNPAVTIAEPESGDMVEGSHVWDLASVALRPGSILEYYLEAQDNRPGAPHVGVSETRRIVITGQDRQEAPAAAGELPPLWPAPLRLVQGAAQEEGADAEGRTDGRRGDLMGQAQRIAEALERRREGGRTPPDAPPGTEQPEGAQPTEPAERAPTSREPESDPGDREQTERRERAASDEDLPDDAAVAASGGGEGGEPGRSGSGGGVRGVGGEGGEETGTAGPGGAAAEQGRTSSYEAAEGAPAPGAGAGQTAGPAGQGGAAGTASGPGSTAAGGRGEGVRRLPAAGVREGELRRREADLAVQELALLMEQDQLSPGLLADLGATREDLRDFIRRYRDARREGGTQDVDVGREAREERGPEGRVIQATGRAQAGVRVRDALPDLARKDALRSRFEGSDERLAPRYRDVVRQYYKALSEEQ